MNTYENYHQPESPPYIDQCYCNNQFYEPCQVCCQPSHAECCEDICEIKNEILHKKCSVVKLVKDQIDKLKECQCLKEPRHPASLESLPQVNNEARSVANARRNSNFPDLSERHELPSSGSPSSGSPLSALDENEYENLADDRARPKFKKWPRNRFIRIALLLFGAYLVWLLLMYIALLLGFFCDDYRNQGAYCTHCWLAGQVWLRFLPGLQWQRPKYYAICQSGKHLNNSGARVKINENMEEDNESLCSINSDENTIKKKTKRGIIYLSTIPPYMNVIRIREFFEDFGKVGNVYLQLADADTKDGGLNKNSQMKKKRKKKKFARNFTEGWVEFERKSVAKKVAAALNNKQVDSRKGSKLYDCLWNIKYLSHFKWTHLNERLAYEKAIRRQKLREEIEQAKKQANIFNLNIEKSSKKQKTNMVNNIRMRKRYVNTEKLEADPDRGGFVANLFHS